MKRFFCIFTAVVCVFTLSVTAFAEEVTEISEIAEEPIGYEISDANEDSYAVQPSFEGNSPSFVGDAETNSEGNSPSFVGNADGEATQVAGAEPQVNNHGVTGNGSVDDINKYWEENGYPSYVSFAYEAGGEVSSDDSVVLWWEIGVVGATEEQKQEILSLVSSKCLVQFVDCEHSYAEKKSVYDELSALGDERIKRVDFGQNNEFLWVYTANMTDDEFKAIANEMRGKYGTVLQFLSEEASDGFDIGGAEIGMGETTITTGVESKNDYTLWLVTAAIVVLVSAVAVTAIIRVRSRARVTVDGTVATGNEKASAVKVKQAVAKSEASPDDKVLDEILKKID